MRRLLLLIIPLLLLIVSVSCRKDFDYALGRGNLGFSKDTVFLDTVFTNIGSATYTLKVYNTSNKDIAIPFVGLAKGEQSAYRLNVDGRAGKTFANIPLLAKDSLYVFIETTFDISNLSQNEFLYTDSLIFGADGDEQTVQLVTLVKDAVFLYPSRLTDGTKETIPLGFDEEGNEIRVEGFYLKDEELRFTQEKPYIIYGYATVAEGKTLTIDAGARIHFHKDSGILVQEGGSMQVNGLPSENEEINENEVIFEGDRLEPGYADIAGQWGAIWLAEGSIDNRIEHTTRKNGTVGILVEGNTNDPEPKLRLRNVQVLNSSSVNLWAVNTAVQAENLVLGNAGFSSLYCQLGGTYDFKHATIANYWDDGFRGGPAVLIDNFIETPSNATGNDLVAATFTNCIIDGNKNIELLLKKNDLYEFLYAFTNCLITFNDVNGQYLANSLFDFQDIEHYQNILLNANAEFMAPAQNNFLIGEGSEAIDAGDVDTALSVPFDIRGVDRTQSPDVGAYEYVPEN